MSIQFGNSDFDFTKISLLTPNGIQGGAYFCKILYDNEELLIQTPKITTKNGMIQTGKKVYTDLLFEEKNNDFIEWLDSLEKHLQTLIYEKRELWFHNELTLDDIEYSFTNTYRTYKGVQSLVRCFVKPSKNFKNIESFSIYNTKEELLGLQDVKNDHKIITILEVGGIKITGGDFRIELYLKQMMVFQPSLTFNKCLIQSNETLEKPIHKESELIEPEKIISKEPQEEEPQEEEHQEVEEVEEPQEVEEVEEPQEVEEVEEPQEVEEVEEVEEPQEVEEVEEVEEPQEVEEQNTNTLVEFNLPEPKKEENITLKTPKDIYYKLYQVALEKAKLARENAIQCFLEAKQIKNTYLLDNTELSDNETDFLESLTEDYA